VKLLHTADIHLREYQDERWEALQKLIEVGRQNKVEIFTICGDLFDKGVDAEDLRPQIREVFSNTGFKVLIIPGNHDSDSYKSGMYFGEDVLVLGSSPFEYGDIRVVGIPFEPIQGEELLRRIRTLTEVLEPNKKNILLCHGELLDAFFSTVDFGAEGEGRYMPFKLSYFDGVNVDYVLAGHFHSKFDVWQLKNGGYFVYPGSPVSITMREVGQRKVNLFEIGGPPSEYVLGTPHYEEVPIEFDPFKDEDPLEIVKVSLRKAHPTAKIILTVGGYINGKEIHMTEEELVNRIKEIGVGRYVADSYNFRDISRIVEDDLFANCIRKLEEAGHSVEKTKQLREVTIRAMMKAGL
jgi:DNA repair exonuclease SbcCD nuclease subunit